MAQWFKDFRYARFSSSLARRLLALIYREKQVYPILFGPTRGMKIRFHAAMTYHAALGMHEKESVEAIVKIIKALQDIYPHTTLAMADVGANLGTYTLLLAKLARPGEQIYAFEPSPDVAATLRANIELNHLDQVTVVEKAVSDHIGTLAFYLGHNHYTGSLLTERGAVNTQTQSKVEVQSTTLDDYFASIGGIAPHFIKMDIEGGGVFALKRCDHIVAQSRPSFYIESHSPDEDRTIGEFAQRQSYEVYRLSNSRWVTNLDETHPHPDGVWGNLLLFPAEQSAIFRTLFV
jgi:FkbM family methyltransferase